MRNRSFLGTLAALAFLLPFTAGCGDDATGPNGDDEGTARAVVTDDPNSGSASVAPGDARFSQSFTGAQFEGTFSGQAQVQISVDGETWIDLGSAQNVSFAMQSNEQAVVHASANVPAQTFTRVRLILSNGQATVVSGSVGTIPITTQVQIMVAGGSEIMIEKALSVDISAGSETTVVFDLNSESWVNETNVQSQAATAAEVASATTVRVQ